MKTHVRELHQTVMEMEMVYSTMCLGRISRYKWSPEADDANDVFPVFFGSKKSVYT